MSWKKNAFSYLLWILYAVLAEVGLVCLADAVCGVMGLEIYIGTIAGALYIAAAGLGVYLIHRLAPKHHWTGERKHSLRVLTELAVTVLFLAAGLVLRAREIGGTAEGNIYYELAAMVSEEEIPWFSHGAVSFYIQMLHGLFYFLGNKLTVAVWAQILFQLCAVLLLYFAVRQSAGRIAAIVMLGFCMFSSYLRKEALELSPAMLYLFLWSAALLLTVTMARAKKSLWGFPAVGLVISVVSYLDVAGCLLLLVSAAVIFCEEEERPEKGRRLKCLLLCLMGAGVGFVGCLLAEALMSGAAFTEAAAGWFQRYRPLGFGLPVSADASGTTVSATVKVMTEYIILFCVLTPGIFSFWRNRRSDYRKVWMILLIVLVPAGCFGIFTEEMPMGLYLYLLLTLMAGIAVEECIRERKPVPEAAALMSAETVLPQEPAAAPLPEGNAAAQSQGQGKTGGENASPQHGEGGAASQTEGEDAPQTEGEDAPQPRKVKLIENPLPLPKKHVRKKLDYEVNVPAGKEEFDLEVDEKDDFDI